MKKKFKWSPELLKQMSLMERNDAEVGSIKRGEREGERRQNADMHEGFTVGTGLQQTTELDLPKKKKKTPAGTQVLGLLFNASAWGKREKHKMSLQVKADD